MVKIKIMDNKYLRSDWDIVSLRYKDGDIINNGHDFDIHVKFHLDDNKSYSEKIDYYPEIFSVRNNKRNGEILSLGDDMCVTTDMSEYEDIRNLPTRLHGKVTKFWASFEQMRIDINRCGMPMSEITGVYGG